MQRLICVLTRIVAICAIAFLAEQWHCRAEEPGPWPADVQGWKAPEAGEHPRLFFRKSDLPALRERAKTPEGQALLKRLRVTLNGSDGESMPTKFGEKGKVAADGVGQFDKEPAGMYTLSHVAGFGFLYQITGDRKYADLGRQCMDKALEEQRDRDQRYSFKHPFGALRAGPSLGWYAVGYDLCYDGWDEEYRKKIALAIQNYNEGSNASLDELVRGSRHIPGSNHWGMQVGGGALALLAILNDPGVDMAKLTPLVSKSQEAMIKNMTQGFGDGGFFAEGDGTGSMSSHIVFLPALQAWKIAGGKDFISPRPNAQWMALKWIFLTVPDGQSADFRKFFPERGGYPHNIWSREGKSGAGYFGIGFGAVTEQQKPALLWFYNQHLRALDERNGTPYDATTPYPHHAIMSFVNWPMGIQEKNPGEVLPHAYRDSKWGFYAWRNRWQDPNDIVISILTRASKGFMGAKGETTLNIQASGKKMTWGKVTGFTGDFAPAKDGSTILTTGDGSCLAIDFSKASGADAMLVMTGPGAPLANAVEAGGRKFSFLFWGKEAPSPVVDGDKVKAGGQIVSFDGKKIVLEKQK